MKRLLTGVLVLACLMAAFCPAFAVVECQVPETVAMGAAAPDAMLLGGAGETYATMGDLYQAWGGWEGYPDYICGVWSTDGGMTCLTVAVTDDKAGEKGKQEILSLLADPNTVTFTTQKYSYRELLAVMDDITARMGADSPIVACGIYEMENKVHATMLETAENAKTIAEEVAEKHGDKIVVELGSEIILDTTASQSAASKTGWGLVATAVLLLIGLTFALKRPVWVTNTGKVVTAGKPTRAQVETAIAQHTETPPEWVEQALNRKL